MPVKIWTVTCRVAYRGRFTFALGRVRCKTTLDPCPLAVSKAYVLEFDLELLAVVEVYRISPRLAVE